MFLIGVSAQTEQDTVKTSGDSVVIQKETTKSPWGAVLRSAVLPGWGQYYNESYWKIPLIWGVFAAQTYYWNENNDTYREHKKEFIETGNIRAKRIRDSARDQRDQILIYGILVYFLQLVDSYVDAHLFNFDVSENAFTRQPEISFRINF